MLSACIAYFDVMSQTTLDIEAVCEVEENVQLRIDGTLAYPKC
jgi:hypothetical protein